MDVIIFSGQSNMQGQTEALTTISEVPNCYEYKFIENTIVPLKNPVGEDITYSHEKGFPLMPDTDFDLWLTTNLTGSSCYGNTNMVPEFCKCYSEITGNDVLAVHIAKGSADIATWDNDSSLYTLTVKKSLVAIKAAKEKSNVGKILFVWLQGESDAIYANSRDYYKDKLRNLKNALFRDIGIEKFGIILVGRFTGDSRDDEIISAQKEICQNDKDFIMLTEIAEEMYRNPKYMNPFVSGHYSAKGLEHLGHIAGMSLAQTVLN